MSDSAEIEAKQIAARESEAYKRIPGLSETEVSLP